MSIFKVKTIAVDYVMSRVRDLKSLVISLIVPVAIILLFGTITNMSEGRYRIGVTLIGIESEDFAEMFNPYETFEMIYFQESDEGSILREMSSKNLSGYVVASREGRKTLLEYFSNGSMSISSSIVKGMLRSQADRLNQHYYDGKIVLEKVAASDTSKDLIAPLSAVFETADSLPPLDDQDVVINEMRTGTPSLYNRYNSILPGMAGMFILFAALFGGIQSIFEDRDQKIFQRLLAIPCTRTEIIVGKISGIFLFALAQAVFMVLFARHALGMRAVSGISVRLLLVAYALTATSLTVFVSTFIHKKSQIEGVAIPVILLLSVIGGFWFPLEQAGVVVRTVSLFTPTGLMMRASQDLLSHGAGLAVVYPYILGLAGFSFVLLLAGIKRVRWISNT